MRKLAVAILLLQFLALPALAAPGDAVCTLCVGLYGGDGTVAPALVRLDEQSYPTFAPGRAANVSVIVEYSAKELEEVEQKTQQIVAWAKSRGPFEALGVSVKTDDPALRAYAIKRLSVVAQGQQAAGQILLDGRNASMFNVVMETKERSELIDLLDQGAGTYFDILVVDAPAVALSLATLMERDPSKKIHATVTLSSPNALYDLGRALADGATRAYAVGNVDPAALAQFNRTTTGDWAFDATARIGVIDAKAAPVDMPVLSFVRGEDLRTLLITRGDAASPFIVSLPADRYVRPKRIDAKGERAATDTGVRGANLLVGSPAATEPHALIVDYAEVPNRNVTKETMSIATERGITVEEIIRNHQSYDAYQESIQPRYIARNTTRLRFDIGGGAESLEAAIAGDYFSEPKGRADWVWAEFYINGVKWKYGKIPELPLIQPEKVTQLPLDIHLTNEYRYELVRATDLLGYRVYEVRFEPPRNAPADLPLYRGTVFIDTKSWARVRIAMVQLNLTGEVLSNEERVDFVPFSRETGRPLTPAEATALDARSLIWLPAVVNAQQVVSAAGRASVVQRSTTFENFRVDPEDFASSLALASESDARMVRETVAGLRYLEKRDGERVVKEGFDTAQIFALGGLHHDDGIDYPVVPLGGIDYFNFNLFHKGIQTNVFFAGVILAANVTHPNVANTRTNIGADFFGIAVPTENVIHRNGEERPEESVKARPMGLFVRAGHPFLQFGKIDVSLGVSHASYSRGDDTASTFAIPSSTFTVTPGIELRYARRGWSLSGSYDYNRRGEWEAWGDPAEYNPDQKTFTRFGVSLGKSFYLPKFQRIGVDISYLDGQRLDRFSKYELGFFGSQRVHGVQSGSVRAEKAIIGHLSYGFVLSEQFRLEAFYDHALIDDAAAGYAREPFQGLGLAGQTIGPWGTLLRLDIGKTIGRNAQDGFVANVVFLKLF